MLFNRPSSLLVTDPQRYFEIENEHHFIADPFEVPPIQLLGNRVLTENEYFPFLYLKSGYDGYHSLVLFATRDAAQIIAWKVNPKAPAEYVGQFQFPASDLKFLFALSEAPIADIQ